MCEKGVELIPTQGNGNPTHIHKADEEHSMDSSVLKAPEHGLGDWEHAI